jgi:hypothetical protein
MCRLGKETESSVGDPDINHVRGPKFGLDIEGREPYPRNAASPQSQKGNFSVEYPTKTSSLWTFLHLGLCTLLKPPNARRQ